MKPLYISATGQDSGKTAVICGLIRIVIKNCAFDITAHVIASEAKQSLFAEFEIATAIFNGLAMTLQRYY